MLNIRNTGYIEAPYFAADYETHTDWEGWTHYIEVPAVSGKSLARWLSRGVLLRTVADIERHVQPGFVSDRTYLTPAGDLFIRQDIPTKLPLSVKFITASALVGHATEYRLDFSYDCDIDPIVEMSTIENGPEDLNTEFEVFHLTPRDPFAVRLRELVTLVNTTN